MTNRCKFITIEIVSKDTCRKLNAWQYDSQQLPNILPISQGDDTLDFGNINVSIPGKYKLDVVYLDSKNRVVCRETKDNNIEVKFDPCKKNPYCPIPVIPLPTHKQSKNMRKDVCRPCNKLINPSELKRMDIIQKRNVANKILNKF